MGWVIVWSRNGFRILLSWRGLRRWFGLVVQYGRLLVWLVYRGRWLIGLLVSWTCRASAAGVLARLTVRQ